MLILYVDEAIDGEERERQRDIEQTRLTTLRFISLLYLKYQSISICFSRLSLSYTHVLNVIDLISLIKSGNNNKQQQTPDFHGRRNWLIINKLKCQVYFSLLFEHIKTLGYICYKMVEVIQSFYYINIGGRKRIKFKNYDFNFSMCNFINKNRKKIIFGAAKLADFFSLYVIDTFADSFDKIISIKYFNKLEVGRRY